MIFGRVICGVDATEESLDAARQAARLTDDDGHKVSTLDITGRGLFTLVTGLAGAAWREAAEKLDLPWLRTVVVGAPGAHDAYFAWHRAREVEEAGCVLVRPDGYVAWRRTTGVADVATAGDAMSAREVALLIRGHLGEAAGSRVSTKLMPDWMLRAAAPFSRRVRGSLPEIGVRRNATSAKAIAQLGWDPRSREEAVLATVDTLPPRLR